MPKLTESEKLKMRSRLLEQISAWMDIETDNDNNIGSIPDNTEVLMTNAAFSILEAVNSTNDYFESQGMLK